MRIFNFSEHYSQQYPVIYTVVGPMDWNSSDDLRDPLASSSSYRRACMLKRALLLTFSLRSEMTMIYEIALYLFIVCPMQSAALDRI